MMARVIPLLALFVVVTATADDNISADAYATCSACHLPDGVGVPGAFPPIRNRAAAIARLEGGREYLATVVTYGLMGTIQVDGAQYFGVMAGLGAAMSNEDIAAALNYIVFELSDDEVADVEPFTAEEVERARAAVEVKSPAGGGQMRVELAERNGGRLP
jgi:mono/diheme cytochrome c family protein